MKGLPKDNTLEKNTENLGNTCQTACMRQALELIKEKEASAERYSTDSSNCRNCQKYFGFLGDPVPILSASRDKRSGNMK